MLPLTLSLRINLQCVVIVGVLKNLKNISPISEGTAVCKGDSGGGLAFLAIDKDVRRYYLRGIASTAPTNDNACNGDTFTTFTRLLSHEHFITRYWRD